MSRPVVLAVDDEPVALGAIGGELRKRYGVDYQVVCAAFPEVGLRRLERLKDDGGQVALVLADQWMPSMTRPAFLSRVHALYPEAQRVVLINWGDRSAAESILQAAALGQVDDWAAKPWGPGMSSSIKPSADTCMSGRGCTVLGSRPSRSWGSSGLPGPMTSGTC